MADRIDIVWNRFKRLLPIAKLILSLPNSSAEEERFLLWLRGIRLLFVQILILKKPWEIF